MYDEILKEARHDVEFACMKAALNLDGDREIDMKTLRIRYASIMTAIGMLVDFVKAWDSAKNNDEREAALVEAAAQVLSIGEMVAMLSETKNEAEYRQMLIDQVNELDSVVCELEPDTAKAIAHILDMEYDELLEKHWNSHVRCNENGDLELYNEE